MQNKYYYKLPLSQSESFSTPSTLCKFSATSSCKRAAFSFDNIAGIFYKLVTRTRRTSSLLHLSDFKRASKFR